MPTVDIYSKQQVDALIASAGGLPDPASASAGDVLTLDSNKDPAWVAPSGGRTITQITTNAELIDAISSMNIGDQIVTNELIFDSTSKILQMVATLIGISAQGNRMLACDGSHRTGSSSYPMAYLQVTAVNGQITGASRIYLNYYNTISSVTGGDVALNTIQLSSNWNLYVING